MYWAKTDLKMLKRRIQVIENTAHTPFEGIDKLEPLKYRKGAWSQRIDNEHRLVYDVTNDAIIKSACRFHYE
jgi:toxin YoeB